MYDYISGILKRKTENYCVVDASGIGYRILMSARSLAGMGETGINTTVYTYLYLREDIMELYGFITAEERSAFEMLISVSGVGPKAALSILSSLTESALAVAIVTNDAKSITKAQGIGPKLAQRIILELKDKIKSQDLKAKSSDFAPASDISDDALSALVVLGYSRSEAEKALNGVPSDASVEDSIKIALTKLMKY